MKSRIVWLVFALAFLAVFALGLMRALPAAKDGEILVVDGAVHRGPVRLVVAPWAARAVVPLTLHATSSYTADIGSGSTWTFTAEADVALDPDRLDDATRARLLAGAGAEALASDALERAFASLAPRTDWSAALGHPAGLQTPLAAELAAQLAKGFRATDIRVSLPIDAERARSLALASLRTKRTEPLARVLYVGFDGADWEIAGPMIARGELPHLARLVQEGVRANLLSYEPMMSPLLWNTAVTGVGPDVHGICDFTVAASDGKHLPISSSFRRAPALWEMLSAAGERGAFFNFWATQPVEEIEGVIVSDGADKLVSSPDRGSPLPPGLAWPPGFLDERAAKLFTTDTVPAALVRAYYPQATDSEIDAARAFWRDPEMRRRYKEAQGEEGRKSPPLAFLLQIATHSANNEALAAEAARDPSLGIVAVYFGDIDLIGHNFQHLAPPPHPLADPKERAFAGVVEATYRQQDAALGRLVEAAGPGTIVVVHSDHGFLWQERRPPDIHPFTRGQPVEWHRLQGLFVAAGGPLRKGVAVPDITLFEIAPTLLAMRGLPAGADMPGQVRLDLFDERVHAGFPAERVPSWAALVGPRRYEAGSEEDLQEARERMLETLRGLGYVGDDPEPRGEDAVTGTAAAARTGEGDRPRETYHRNLATYFMNQSRFAEAERELLAANEIQPLPKTYALLSEARAARSDLEGAIAALEEGAAKLPRATSPSTALWLVELELQRGDVARAAERLARHRALAEREPAVLYVAEGRLAEARGQTETARDAYRRALDADPRTTRALERLLALATSSAERAALEPYLLRALERDPKIEIYWSVLGTLRGERGDAPAAAFAFGRAVELEPDSVEYRTNLATALLRAGRKAEARAHYEHLARADVPIAALWVNLGSLRAEAGEWRGALQAWQRAQALGADSPSLRESIELARRRSGA